MHFIPGFRSQLVTASKSRRQFVLSTREVERLGEEEGSTTRAEQFPPGL